jgi:hypothetical protein
MKRVLYNFLCDRTNQDLMEYAFLMVCVAIGSYGLGGWWAYHQLGHLRYR